MSDLPSRAPRRKRPHHTTWPVTRGGSRLNKLKSALVGDQNAVDALATDNPRRQVSLARVRFLEVEEPNT
jgi:hypothetical protein